MNLWEKKTLVNNRLENLGFYFGLRLLGFLLMLTATISVAYFLYASSTGMDTETALVFVTALLQLVVPLWLFIFLLAYPLLLTRLDQTGIRSRAGIKTITWNSLDRVSITSTPGASFLNKVTLSSQTSSASIYIGQYLRSNELKRYIANHLDWLDESQLNEPCVVTRPPQ